MRPRTDRQTDTQTRVTTIHFASSTTHAKCNHVPTKTLLRCKPRVSSLRDTERQAWLSLYTTHHRLSAPALTVSNHSSLSLSLSLFLRLLLVLCFVSDDVIAMTHHSTVTVMIASADEHLVAYSGALLGCTWVHPRLLRFAKLRVEFLSYPFGGLGESQMLHAYVVGRMVDFL